MKAAIGALVAVVAAGASAAGIAAWTRRNKADEEQELAAATAERAEAPEMPELPKEPEVSEGGGTGDDLTTIKGIGAINQERLAAAGVTTFAQIAAWSGDDIESMGDRIGVSPGRIRREDWVGQAQAIAEG